MSGLCERLGTAVERVQALVGARDAASFAAVLDDAALVAGMRDVAEALKSLEVVKAGLAAEIDRRSARSLGYTGLAQRTGHRTPTSLIQELTGQSAADVRRVTSAGHDLVAAGGGGASGVGAGGEASVAGEVGAADAGVGDDPTDGQGAADAGPWFAPLTSALVEGVISRAQFEAIRRGLGEPPARDIGSAAARADEARAVWRHAAVMLVEEAADLVLEDLRAAARLARDTLDPVGVAVRFEERYARRSFRMWVDEDGQHHARIAFDDDAAAWVRTVLNAALRPRRGPRFVDSAAVRADVAADSRTNEQLQYDTMMAVLRTGAQADPAQAFGDRQPGVRVVAMRDDLDRRDEHGDSAAVAYFEETGQTIPTGVLETYLCDAGHKPVTVDAGGRPLDVGREHRLFTKKQRDAMAIRDGGCLDCGAEPSRCEAHHIDHWWEHGGRTDLADGVLLCRSCHMRLHNQRARIVREESVYWLEPPPGSGLPRRRLRPRSLLRFRQVA